MADTSAGALQKQIAAVLARVPDPEIPVISIVDLGIVRDIGHDANGSWVALTPTYTGCPATAVIKQATRDALDNAGFGHVELRVVLSPAWSTDMITDQGREKLRRYGIAPPEPSSPDVPCPRCGSRNTAEVSRFGSTPCKALWRCLACHEPFDRFKCH
jgi:ring-1,2-phenylacetyl-CoA epoxidase subunit PaaD